MLDVSLRKVEVKKNALRREKWFATFLCECFPWDILNEYTQQLNHDSELWEQEKKKDGCGMLGLCILTSESPFEKSFQSHRTAKHSKKNHIYPHYWRSTLKPPRSKKSKANPIQTASLTSTRFVSMAVFHSYTSKEKGLQFMWHPNPGLSLSIRALCIRSVPAKTTQLDCYEQFVAWACDLIAPRGYLLMFLI